MLTEVNPELPPPSMAGLDDAPTTLFDQPVPAFLARSASQPPKNTEDDTEVGGATVEERRDPWAAVGLRLAAGIAAQYRLTAVIASGGPVEAFLAEHLFLGRTVLIKALAADTAGSAEARAFLAEATALWQLSHPSFPAVLEYGTELGGRPFAIMEYAAGESLAVRLATAPLSAELALDLAEQIAAALAAAHGRGVAHGALGPEVIHLCPDSALRAGLRVKIADFAAGLAIEGGDETSVVIARAVGAADPADDRRAAADLFERLGAAAGLDLPAAVARSLERLVASLRTETRTSALADAARELRRLQLEISLERGRGHTARITARPPRLVSLWHGAAVLGGAVALAAMLGAIL